MFVQYLSSREEALSEYHPQWDLTNEEISSSSSLLKRDRTPICIPPSWDLVQKYAGPNDERADGFDENIFDNKTKRLFTGDRSEAEFLNAMRNLQIGGILIGDIDSKELMNLSSGINDESIVIRSPKLCEFLKNGECYRKNYFNANNLAPCKTWRQQVHTLLHHVGRQFFDCLPRGPTTGRGYLVEVIR